jgi:hypothetical protein
MVRVRIIARPKKLICAYMFYDVSESPLIRVSRDPTVTGKIEARLFFQQGCCL